jgi:hypothetical protein
MPSAIERLYNLNVGIIGAAGERKARPERIPWCGASATVARHPAAELKKNRPRKRHNDHPCNRSLARHCQRRRLTSKHHHRAMDWNIIATGPALHWHVSKLIDTRRLKGAQDLLALSGEDLQLSQDDAFHLDANGLKWRRDRLIA